MLCALVFLLVARGAASAGLRSTTSQVANVARVLDNAVRTASASVSVHYVPCAPITSYCMPSFAYFVIVIVQSILKGTLNIINTKGKGIIPDW